MAERCGCDRHKTGVQGVFACLREFLNKARGANGMGLRFFVVPVHDSSAFEQDLNGFLARHKVVSIDRHLIDEGVNSFWAICVDYLSHTPGETGHNLNLSRNRVDYKTVFRLERPAGHVSSRSALTPKLS
jgi:hypothetical protein